MLCKATVLTTIVDDATKASPEIQRALKRPGTRPRLSDSEIVTLALYQELIGEPREDHFFRLHRWSLLPYFPRLNERSRYNRRKRDLWTVILAVRLTLQLVPDSLEFEQTGVVDSAPVQSIGGLREFRSRFDARYSGRYSPPPSFLCSPSPTTPGPQLTPSAMDETVPRRTSARPSPRRAGRGRSGRRCRIRTD